MILVMRRGVVLPNPDRFFMKSAERVYTGAISIYCVHLHLHLLTLDFEKADWKLYSTRTNEASGKSTSPPVTRTDNYDTETANQLLGSLREARKLKWINSVSSIDFKHFSSQPSCTD